MIIWWGLVPLAGWCRGPHIVCLSMSFEGDFFWAADFHQECPFHGQHDCRFSPYKQYFFLWGYLKSLVYKDQTKTLAAWKNNICYEIGRPTSGNEWINWAFRNRHTTFCHHALTTSLSPFGLSACRVFKTTYFKISRLDYIKLILNWIFFIGCFIIPNWKK